MHLAGSESSLRIGSDSIRIIIARRALVGSLASGLLAERDRTATVHSSALIIMIVSDFWRLIGFCGKYQRRNKYPIINSHHSISLMRFQSIQQTYIIDTPHTKLV